MDRLYVVKQYVKIMEKLDVVTNIYSIRIYFQHRLIAIFEFMITSHACLMHRSRQRHHHHRHQHYYRHLMKLPRMRRQGAHYGTGDALSKMCT